MQVVSQPSLRKERAREQIWLEEQAALEAWQTKLQSGEGTAVLSEGTTGVSDGMTGEPDGETAAQFA